MNRRCEAYLRSLEKRQHTGQTRKLLPGWARFISIADNTMKRCVITSVRHSAGATGRQTRRGVVEIAPTHTGNWRVRKVCRIWSKSISDAQTILMRKQSTLYRQRIAKQIEDAQGLSSLAEWLAKADNATKR